MYAAAMIRQFCPKAPLCGAFAASLFVAVVPAMADEAAYCITCTGPDQTYVCRVDAGGSKPSDALKLYCVIRTAKEGHHASCAAERASPDCHGVEKVYSYDGPLPPDLATDPRLKHFTDKINQDQQAFDKPKGDAPKTLVELGGRAVSGLRHARQAISGSSSDADQKLPGEPLSGDQTPAPPAADPAATPDASVDATRSNRAQRAGAAVGGFARQSYRCLRSFFRNCSGETADAQAPQ